MNGIKNFLVIAFICIVSVVIYRYVLAYKHENIILKEIVSRLEADSRVAEVLVTGVNFDEELQKTFTTIKFLEYDSKGNSLNPRYFKFSGNIIQFQSLVIRFDDIHVRKASKFKGKSAFIFWKVFMLDGENTQEYEITKINTVPLGYKIENTVDSFEESLWRNFWKYALDPKRSKDMGIKNVQIEAPGTMFIPGIIYTIKIEHDGGLRIDTSKISPILKGEEVLN